MFNHTFHLVQWNWCTSHVFSPLPVTAGDACIELVEVVVLCRPFFVLLGRKNLAWWIKQKQTESKHALKIRGRITKG